MLKCEFIMGKPSSPPLKTVLLVDDEHDVRVVTRWFLASFGYVVESVRSAEEALALFNPRIHDLVITDNSMPGMTGAEMAQVIKRRSPSTPVMMHTGNPPEDRSALDAVIQRPVHLLTVKEMAERLLAGLKA